MMTYLPAYALLYLEYIRFLANPYVLSNGCVLGKPLKAANGFVLLFRSRSASMTNLLLKNPLLKNLLLKKNDHSLTEPKPINLAKDEDSVKTQNLVRMLSY